MRHVRQYVGMLSQEGLEGREEVRELIIVDIRVYRRRIRSEY